MHPLRSPTTYTEALGDEVCVYEWARHEVHALNPTAACVWQLCDGKTSVGEMAERLREGQLPFAEQLVELALEAFKNKHLLDADRTAPAASPPMSRRALVKRGLTAALLPVVASVVAPTPLQAQSPGARLQTFDFTGTSQAFIVPPGSTSVTVLAFGAQGRGYFEGQPDGSPGGLGGSITATLAVTPGETLVVVVGGIPLPVGIAHGPGFNGGGRSGSSISKFAGPGGGASDVRRGGSALDNRVVVAGGGGGAGTGPAAAGGAGGGTVGGDGGGSLSGAAGTGGTQTAGGIGGVSPPFPFGRGQSGVSGIGGDGGSFVVPGGGGSLGSAGGGGGGGYYGGGGGGAPSSGGGGGSSFAHPSATGVVHVQGTRAGAGLVVLSW